MKHRLLFLLAFIGFFSSAAFAGFEEGKRAYDQQDWAKAITELRPLAEAGDDRAMILIGNMYSQGFGVIRSYKEALDLYRRAAVEKNNPEAMLAMGALYTSGLGVPVSFNIAKQWYERAALLGNQQGAFFYATVLFRGNKSTTDDLKPDLYSAYKWYKIAAAEKGNQKVADTASEIAKIMAKEKLTPEEVVKADKEAAEWKPLTVKDLGPSSEIGGPSSQP
jgi:uncharacterized protein